MSVFDHTEFAAHESVHHFDDPSSGLRAIIAIHSTALGPAAGGCRRWQYLSAGDALTDVLRLSRGMSYKNAVAGLPFGGGKAVILASAGSPGTPAQFRAFGQLVDSLGGHYITAEDVGVSVDDMRVVRGETRFVSGLPQCGSSAGGDPSPWTAYGVFLGIEAAAKTKLGVESLSGLGIAVQGVGHVGERLCRLLHAAGARLVIADVDRNRLQDLRGDIDATIVSPREILFQDVEVLAPCALGNVLNAQTIPRIRACVIAGAANNQLANEHDGEALMARDILYAPDYVINAGGVISVAREYLGQSSEDQVRAEVQRIPERLQAIFAEAQERGRPTSLVADQLARQIIENRKSNSNLQEHTAGLRIA